MLCASGVGSRGHACLVVRQAATLWAPCLTATDSATWRLDSLCVVAAGSSGSRRRVPRAVDGGIATRATPDCWPLADLPGARVFTARTVRTKSDFYRALVEQQSRCPVIAQRFARLLVKRIYLQQRKNTSFTMQNALRTTTGQQKQFYFFTERRNILQMNGGQQDKLSYKKKKKK